MTCEPSAFAQVLSRFPLESKLSFLLVRALQPLAGGSGRVRFSPIPPRFTGTLCEPRSAVLCHRHRATRRAGRKPSFLEELNSVSDSLVQGLHGLCEPLQGRLGSNTSVLTRGGRRIS